MLRELTTNFATVSPDTEPLVKTSNASATLETT